MKGAFDHPVVKAYRGQDAATLAQAQVDALYGVSAEEARWLREAFGIETVGDLAGHRFVAAAQAIAAPPVDRGHDPGPGVPWAAFFSRAPLAAYQAHHQDFRLGFGPIWYRGRLGGTARVLVVGQDPAPNELVGHRVFVGDQGCANTVTLYFSRRLESPQGRGSTAFGPTDGLSVGEQKIVVGGRGR